MPRLRLFFEWIAIFAVAAAVVWLAASYRITSRLDNQLFDIAAAKLASPTSEDVLIVAIDDRSLASEGQWPWDRRKFARLLDRIAAGKPRLIATDILFTEASDPAADVALANSIAAAGNVVLPYMFVQSANQSAGLDPVRPLPALLAAQAAGGHAVLEADLDGTVRRLPVTFRTADQVHPHLMATAYRLIHGHEPAAATIEADPGLPLRPAGSYRTISANSVLAGDVSADFLAGKVVLIGATAPGLGDIFPVSEAAGGRMAGVELQANLLQALNENRFLRDLPDTETLLLSILPLLLLFAGFWRLRPAWSLALALTLVVAVLIGSYLFVQTRQLWFAPGAALLGLLIAYPLWGWRRLAAVSDFLDERAQRLVSAESGPGVGSLAGFDSIAKQADRLGKLVDEMHERRDFLRRVIEAAPDAMLAFDSTGQLQLLNSPARALFGEKCDGLRFADLVASTRGRVQSEGRELILADGRTFTIARGESASGAELSVMALVDVSEARRAEAERREMLEFLSHDMRSPQVAILSLAGRAHSATEVPERFARIESQARRTLALAEGFVELARLSEARLQTADVELGDLLTECVDRAWTLAKSRKIALVWVPAEDSALWCEADQLVLSRAFDNLIGNAIKYSPSGSTITVAADRNAGTDEICVTIADNGPGLPEERQIDPFARFGARGATIEPGSGLGLAFVKTAVERHQGHISCQSSAESGTTFSIRLPASAEPDYSGG